MTNGELVGGSRRDCISSPGILFFFLYKPLFTGTNNNNIWPPPGMTGTTNGARDADGSQVLLGMFFLLLFFAYCFYR